MRASNRSYLTALATAAWVLSAAPQAGADETRAGLLELIELQQRRLDAQAEQLAEQQQALEALRQQVQTLQAGGGPGAPPPAPVAKRATKTQPPAPSAPETPLAATANAAPKLHTTLKKAANPWPGSWRLPGTDTRMRIGGFVEFNAIHDTDAIATPGAFVTSAIATRNATPAQGADGQTHFGVNASRLTLETRTPVAGRQVRTFTSVDWFGDFTSNSPELRLRQAYGEVENLAFGGALLVGQAWTTYTNLGAVPNTLDFEGPNSLLGSRRPMLRWTQPFSPALQLQLAAEAPNSRNFTGAQALSRWPDGVAALRWASGGLNVQGSVLARDLRAADGARVDSRLGWGMNLAGRVHMPGALAQDFATWSLSYGEGIGGLLNDAPAGAVFDSARGTLETISTLAWYLGYQHWWNTDLYSVLSYGEVHQDNLASQPLTAFQQSRYGTANLVWTPEPKWLLGVEAMYGSREDRDGRQGRDLRTQFTGRFSF